MWWDDPDVCSTASAVAKRFRGYVDADDIKSVLVLWCLENESTALKVWEGPWWFKQRRLWTIAQRFARHEKAIAVGHEIEDEFFYSASLVKHLLPDAFDNEALPPRNGISDVKVKSTNVSRGGEWETMIADVRRALELLPDKDFDILFALYGGHRTTLTAYCEVHGWDYRKGIKAERGAARRLVDLLGGVTPWAEDTNTVPPETPPEPRRDTNKVGSIHG